MKDPSSKKNLDGYGAPIIPWEKVHKRIQKGFTQAPKTGGPDRHTAWLATVRPDGKPHVMPIGVLFVDDAFYFNTGPKTLKARNIARDPSSVKDGSRPSSREASQPSTALQARGRHLGMCTK